MARVNWTVRKRRIAEYYAQLEAGGKLLITHRKWTKKELKTRVKDGGPLPAESVLQETSMFGREIRPNTVVVACLNHPQRTTFAKIKIDADENIVAVQ